MSTNITTERLYEKDSYCKEFTATVISCKAFDECYHIVLDRTAFFPEGGGQSSDVGKLNEVDVFDVQIIDGVIVHKVLSEIAVGSEVFGKIDWELRFSRMQNHSGEHIISGIVNSAFGYNNVGFHMSKSEMTVDFDGVLTQDDIDRVEKLANEAIYKNLDIRITYPTDEEAAVISYRSKLENIENLRLVTIDDLDVCACCAPHVLKTGEIGLVKIIDSTPNKGGIRLTVKAGSDALLDYMMLNRATKQMMKSLSVSRNLVADASDRQLELINSLKYDNQELLKRVAWCELELVFKGIGAYAISKNLSYEELRHCVNMLAKDGTDICILFSANDDENYIYVISNANGDTQPMVKRLNDEFNGKGGGNPNYAQGKIICKSVDDIKAFAEKLLIE